MLLILSGCESEIHIDEAAWQEEFFGDDNEMEGITIGTIGGIARNSLLANNLESFCALYYAQNLSVCCTLPGKSKQSWKTLAIHQGSTCRELMKISVGLHGSQHKYWYFVDQQLQQQG